jgi:hypothetical protein
VSDNRKEIKGEGLVGLTRGFMYAGSSRVLVSLWSVADQGTSELMTRFYKKMLQENLQPVAALRAAQLEMLHTPQWKSPYYWALLGSLHLARGVEINYFLILLLLTQAPILFLGWHFNPHHYPSKG